MTEEASPQQIEQTLDHCLELAEAASRRFERSTAMLNEADELLARAGRYLSEFGSVDPELLGREIAAWRNHYAVEMARP